MKFCKDCFCNISLAGSQGQLFIQNILVASLIDMMKLKEIKDNAKKYIALCKLLCTDSRTPLIAKILLWIAIGYAISPIDLIPDFIPVIGYLDDIIILPALLYIAIKSVPKEVYTENYNQAFNKLTEVQ